MAIKNLLSQFTNNLRRVVESLTGAVPSTLVPANLRMGADPQYAIAADEYVVCTVPAFSVLHKVYLVVEQVGLGAANVTLNAPTPVVLITAAPITAKGITVSAVADIYVDAPTTISVALTLDQTEAVANGLMKVVAQFTAINTNNGMYGG